jgi:PAS domain S-box-containing protein
MSPNLVADAHDHHPSFVRVAGQLAVVAALYFVCTSVGLLVLFRPTSPATAILWPANVLLILVFLRAPYPLWPLHVVAAFAGALAANALGPDMPISRLAATFVATAGHGVLGAAAMRSLGDTSRALDTVPGFARFVLLAAIIAPAVATAVSSLTLYTLGWIEDPDVYWRRRFVTSALSTLALAPPCLYLLHRPRRRPPLRPVRIIEFLALVALMVASLRVADQVVSPRTLFPLLFAVLPFLVWAAIRFGLAGLSLALTVTTLACFLGGFVSPLWGLDTFDGIISMQFVLIAMVLPLMFVAVLIEDRRRIFDELHRQHARTELATVTSGVAVWDWDLESNAIYIHPAVKRALGYQDHEIRNHMDDWASHVHADDAPLVADAVAAHLAGRTPVFELRHRMVCRDGTIRWFLARGEVVERRAGRAVRMIGTDTDITNQMAAQQRLDHARAEFDQAMRQQELKGLTSTLAQEINQPLCAIVTNASAALRFSSDEDPNYPEIRSALEDVVDDGRRASDLLERTRAVYERADTEVTLLRVDHVVSRAVAVAQQEQAYGCRIRLDLHAGLPPVWASANQLERALANVVGHALTSAGRAPDGIVTVAARRESQDEVRITVHYTGETHDGDRLLEHPATTTRDAMSLGLRMSQLIVDTHGGRIWAERESHDQAALHVNLPAHHEW